MSDPLARLASCVGFAVMIGIAWVCSSDRRRVPWTVVASGSGRCRADGIA